MISIVLCNAILKLNFVQCEEHCRWLEVSELAGCSVPWMPTTNLPECNNYTSMRTIIIEYLKYSVSTACSLKCAKSCHTTQFSAFIVGILKFHPFILLNVIFF
jgi:hypothetical protein